MELPFPPNDDVWIAALCRQHSLRLLSRDRHFDAVSGIMRIDWQEFASCAESPFFAAVRCRRRWVLHLWVLGSGLFQDGSPVGIFPQRRDIMEDSWVDFSGLLFKEGVCSVNIVCRAGIDTATAFFIRLLAVGIRRPNPPVFGIRNASHFVLLGSTSVCQICVRHFFPPPLFLFGPGVKS